MKRERNETDACKGHRIDSVSGLKNNHFLQQHVYTLADEDVSDFVSPPFYPHFKVGECCVWFSCSPKNGSFFIPPRSTFIAVHNFEVGGKGGTHIGGQPFRIGGIIHLDQPADGCF